MGLQKVLDVARQEQRARDLENEVKRREAEAKECGGKKLAHFLNLRPASAKDYLLWLEGYIKNGGRPSHVYDYPFSRWEWYVATRSIEPVAAYGSGAINIIIPAGISVGIGDWGHCNLFYIDGYRACGIVPIFKDTNFPEN